MSKRLSKYNNLTEEQTKKVHESFMQVADSTNLKKDRQFDCMEYVIKISDALLAKNPEEIDAMTHFGHGPIYDIIDTNNDGHISVKEFTIYLKVIAPDVTEDKAKHAFDVIDQDKNGEISREEFFEL